jgi:carbonic anhydrase
MNASSLQKLINGYAHHFLPLYASTQFDHYRTQATLGQQPKIMCISCADSRVDPTILTHAELGEIFTIRNVANIVPPYNHQKNDHHSTGAALEYAVRFLQVEHIIIIGHSSCGGINALLNGTNPSPQSYDFIKPWVHIAHQAKEHVLAKYPEKNRQELQTLTEKEALILSLNNLSTFPWIKDALDKNALLTHAWYFDIPSGVLSQYNQKTQSFHSIVPSTPSSKKNP